MGVRLGWLLGKCCLPSPSSCNMDFLSCSYPAGLQQEATDSMLLTLSSGTQCEEGTRGAGKDPKESRAGEDGVVSGCVGQEWGLGPGQQGARLEAGTA